MDYLVAPDRSELLDRNFRIDKPGFHEVLNLELFKSLYVELALELFQHIRKFYTTLESIGLL